MAVFAAIMAMVIVFGAAIGGVAYVVKAGVAAIADDHSSEPPHSVTNFDLNGHEWARDWHGRDCLASFTEPDSHGMDVCPKHDIFSATFRRTPVPPAPRKAFLRRERWFSRDDQLWLRDHLNRECLSKEAEYVAGVVMCPG